MAVSLPSLPPGLYSVVARSLVQNQGADPAVVVGVCEEEVLLVTVLQARKPGGQPDDRLLDPAEAAAGDARIDPDALVAEYRSDAVVAAGPPITSVGGHCASMGGEAAARIIPIR